MKKVYFACSITGGRDYAHVYQDIVDMIKAEGMEVLSEAFANQSVKAKDGVSMRAGMSPSEVWSWDLNWLTTADGVVAEVSNPSLGVGYEIAKAHQLDKPVLALYHKRPDHKLSSMIVGSPNVTVCEYDIITDTEPAIAKFLAEI
ncbi:MAG TPA: nucleoside 2-deoxyribosyltransferase [Candidatus Saccharimonadales bacterium]|nr:nucleoside 2-deoxyribosyltransferase [Candidatus Saccharimonadales bacterium]